MSEDISAGSTPSFEGTCLNGYQFVKYLSHGRSGSVMVCLNNKGIEVVIKSMLKNSVRQDWVDNEVRAGGSLSHKGLVRFKEHIEDTQYNHIILDMVKGEDLWQFMNNRNWNPLPEKESRKIFSRILKSIDYCHTMGLAHKDIKLENVMINKKSKTTLIDFGFCEFSMLTKLSRRFDGTLDYMPPEMLLRRPFNPYKADVFALGVLLFVLLTGFFPWELKQRCKILSTGGSPVIDWTMPGIPPLSESVKNLIDSMVHPNPEQRFMLTYVSTHPWVKSRAIWQILPNR